MKIYTRTGDKGETYCIATRSRVKKYSRIMDLIGTIDEANSFLGLARSICGVECKTSPYQELYKEVQDLLTRSQRYLFNVGFLISGVNRFEGNEIEDLEKTIDFFMEGIELKGFILPSGTQCASVIHVARTIVRRAERLFFKVLDSDLSSRKDELEYAGKLLNRLSDTLFAAALKIASINRRIEYV